ncbi:hypothetical protein ACHAXT_008959 [Thalassiosira profunda]
MDAHQSALPKDKMSDEEDGNGSLNSGTHCSQLSFASAHSQHSQHSDDGGGGFFADMTLDLSEAQMETTPRTDMKFATLARADIPNLPLIEEPSSEDVATGAVEGRADGNPGDSNIQPVNANAELGTAPHTPERSFARIESDSGFQISTHSITSSAHSFSRPSRTPRRPRDVSWTAAALILMPLGLFLPHLWYSNGYIERHNHHPCAHGDDGGDGGSDHGCHPRHPSWSQMALAPSTHSTILFSSLAATALSLGILRLLYSYPGGGEGDDRRHANITRTLLLASNLCVWLNPILAVSIWHWLPDARTAVLLPLGLMLRDAFRVRNSGSALPSSRGTRSRLDARAMAGRSPGRGASSSHDRKTFFRALAVAALDILSRSLRRKSFVRVASALLLLQFICVSLWWGALSVVLSVEIFQEDGVVTKFMHILWLLLALVAGKWATGTIARLLGFVASGGVASWFDQQTAMIEMMEQQEQHRREQQTTTKSDDNDNPIEEGSDSDDPASRYSSNHAAARAARNAMPEAYRMADASAYTSVLDFDEGLDDDYEEEVEDVGPGRFSSRPGTMHASDHHSTSTVKSFLAAGCTVSFGSVSQCGLLGGLAQFLWSLVRNVDAMGFFLQRRFSNDSLSGFRGMDIAGNGGGGPPSPRQWKRTLAYGWRKADLAIRGFVRSHSDLAMSHVAAYFKSYQRAANDVAALIETSGVESIIHDDITTHMCSSLGHLVAGSMVMFFGMLLITHRNTLSSEPMTDASLLEVLLFSYILCYTILFTVLEPLRAAIKAVYVCFAEHPLSLSRAFPLIYQRLSRISEARQI